MNCFGEAGAAFERLASAPLQMRKLRWSPWRVQEMNSLPVRRHQAGRSSSTEISVERISRMPPGGSGSICFRIRSRSPLPQSMSPAVERNIGFKRMARHRFHRVPR